MSITASINAISAFLSRRDEESVHRTKYDAIVLCGSSLTDTVKLAVDAVRHAAATSTSSSVPRLIITGGIGHSTSLLYDTVRSQPAYSHIPTDGRAESDIFADIAVMHGMNKDGILIERESTNCGANAQYTRRLLDTAGLTASLRTILLIQDPTMQRRTHASFEKWWSDVPGVSFVSYAISVPAVALSATAVASGAQESAMDDLVICAPELDPASTWGISRFISLLTGEIPRLRNDAEGYGPKGKGFIAAVSIVRLGAGGQRRECHPMSVRILVGRLCM